MKFKPPEKPMVPYMRYSRKVRKNLNHIQINQNTNNNILIRYGIL
jgi:hypothetical protein